MALHLTVEISDHDLVCLDQLVGEGLGYVAGDLRELVEHLIRCASDGVRRPGSWERGWIVQATGTSLPGRAPGSPDWA